MRLLHNFGKSVSNDTVATQNRSQAAVRKSTSSKLKSSGARKRNQAVGSCLIGLVTIGPRSRARQLSKRECRGADVHSDRFWHGRRRYWVRFPY
jgi:hypothetical protein